MGIVPDIGVEDGIQAARTMFHRCWFDKDNTQQGLNALRKYQRQLRDDGVSYSPHPLHNFASHPADAFRYLAVAWQNEVKVDVKKVVPIRGLTVGPTNTMTLEQMYATAKRPQREARI